MWTIAGGIILAFSIIYLAPTLLAIVLWVISNIRDIVLFLVQLTFYVLLLISPVLLLYLFYANLKDVAHFIVYNEKLVTAMTLFVSILFLIYLIFTWYKRMNKEIVEHGIKSYIMIRLKKLKRPFSEPTSDDRLIIKLFIILAVPLILWVLLTLLFI